MTTHQDKIRKLADIVAEYGRDCDSPANLMVEYAAMLLLKAADIMDEANAVAESRRHHG